MPSEFLGNNINADLCNPPALDLAALAISYQERTTRA